jgi:hypothetical protein
VTAICHHHERHRTDTTTSGAFSCPVGLVNQGGGEITHSTMVVRRPRLRHP